MDFLFILLGMLIILTLFNVGEGLYKKAKLNHFVLAGFLALTLGLSFVPNLVVGNFSFSLAGFFLPLAASVKFLTSIKSVKQIGVYFISMLISATGYMVYALFAPETFQVVQPYVFAGGGLALVCFLCLKNARLVYSSMFFGLCLGEIIFYQTKFSGSELLIPLGETAVLTTLVLGFTVVLFMEGVRDAYIKRKETRLLKQKN